MECKMEYTVSVKNPWDEMELNDLFEDLKAGYKFGSYLGDVMYPCIHMNLCMDGEYIYWRHYGSSANDATIEDLKFVMETIFEMSPRDFRRKYIRFKSTQLGDVVC